MMLMIWAVFGFAVVVCTNGKLHVPQDGLLMRGQVAPPRKRQQATVFSTTTSFETATTFGGDPTTSTVLVTSTETLTFVDPGQDRTTQTLTVTSSIAPQKRIPQPYSPVRTPLSILPAVSILSSAVVGERGPAMPEKRQGNGLTTTSIITIVSRIIVTVTPTILVTNTVRVITTVTPPISSTTVVIQTVIVGTDNEPQTTLASSTQATSLTTQTSFPTISTTPSGRTLGITLGTSLGAALLIILLLYFCVLRRRRRRHSSKEKSKPKQLCSGLTDTSSDSLEAAEHGTVVHAETFTVGASPPASVAPSASQERRSRHLTSRDGLRVTISQASLRPPPRVKPPPPPLSPTRSPSWQPRNLSVLRWGGPGVDDEREDGLSPGGDEGRSPRHPSAAVAPLALRSSFERRSMTFHDDSSESGSESGSERNTLILGISTDVQPPSPVASSGVFGDDPRSPSSIVAAEGKGGNHSSELPEFEFPEPGAGRWRSRMWVDGGGEANWEDVLAWPERPKRLSRRASRRERESTGAGSGGGRFRWRPGRG